MNPDVTRCMAVMMGYLVFGSFVSSVVYGLCGHSLRDMTIWDVVLWPIPVMIYGSTGYVMTKDERDATYDQHSGFEFKNEPEQWQDFFKKISEDYDEDDGPKGPIL